MYSSLNIFLPLIFYCQKWINIRTSGLVIFKGIKSLLGFPSGLVVKKSPCQCRRCQRHGLGRALGGGNGNPLQYSCLGNPTDRGTWQATVQGVSKSQTELSTHTKSPFQTGEASLGGTYPCALLRLCTNRIPHCRAHSD